MSHELVRAHAVGSFREVFADISSAKASLWEQHLVFGIYDIKEVLQEVNNAGWQDVRLSMKGSTHEFKWNTLKRYLIDNCFNFHSRCVVTNYVYALKRGGVIK